MSVKQFKNDKNYILKKIQLETKDRLLKKLIKMSSDTYTNKSNPLGLIDKTTNRLNKIREYIRESLRNWFKKEKWVRIDTQGNIAGKCGTMPKGKATQRCLPRAKAQSLTKAQRRATARKKVRGSKKGKQFVRNTKKARVKLKK